MSRYVILEEIACGTTASVFLAEDRVLLRKVAIKRLHPHLLNHEESVRRFEKEAVAVARVSHENIVRLYDFGNKGRSLYMAMEYVEGSTLEDLIAGFGSALPVRVCNSLFHQLMKGLSAAHGIGVVHRDIKPSNLLVNRIGRVLIADFGIAFLSEEKNITRTGAFLGTPTYSAPEQARCQPATDKSDIFSSGILFYRCLTGKLPFEGETSHAILSAILEKTPAKPSLVNPRILPGFAELTLAMLAKDPSARPSAAECLRELEALIVSHGMTFEADPVRQFACDSWGYAEKENAELSLHFLELARKAESEGRVRQAVKLAVRAKLHGPVPDEGVQEIRRLQSVGRSSLLQRVLAFSAIVLALLFIGGIWVGQPGKKVTASADSTATASEPLLPGIAAGSRNLSTGSGAIEDPQTLVPTASDKAPVARAGKALSRIRRLHLLPLDPVRVAKDSTKVGVATTGYMIVKTNPPFAAVSLDGRQLGLTPFLAPVEVPSGRQQLLIEREGCRPAVFQALIEPGLTVTLRLALDRAEEAEQ